MKRSLLVAAGALVALLLPATAIAKGPSEATISGPGLSSALTFRGGGEGGDTTLGVLVAQGGFFPQVFGQSPDPLLAARPSGLGPSYTVMYTVPGPSTDTLRQDLYPYAEQGPVTYMAPGQKIWDQTTHGGWYRGTTELRSRLVKAGLPKAASVERRRAAGSRTAITLGAGAGLVLAAGALVLLRRRR